MGATVKDQAKIESHAVIAAGSVVGDGVKVPSN